MRARQLTGFVLTTIIAFCEMGLARDDPMEAVAEQAAVLAAAPELASGTLALDEITLEGGAFVWITVEQDGLYTLSTDKPGALVLGGIPSADGRYDGTTAAQNYLSSMSQDEPPSIGPVLLSTAHPYLLSVSSQAGATTLALALAERLPEVSELPAEDSPAAAGDTLYALESDLKLVLPGSTTARRIDLITEPRAKLRAELGGGAMPASGVYPWLSDKDTALEISAKVAGEAPPARVLLRVTTSDLGLDETEPNRKTPNAWSPDTPFTGHLLPGDEDHLAFSLQNDAHWALNVATGMQGTEFSLRLYHLADGKSRPLWSREPGALGLADAPLRLEAGDYRLELEREDRKSEPLPYTVSMAPSTAPGANDEVEPNDKPATAMPLPESLRVSGSASEDDIDHYLFTVPEDKPQHLWRIFGVGVSRIVLDGDDGSIAKVRAGGRRTTVDSLALEPGTYTIALRAEGEYLLRVMDLGERPSDFEGEPNDNHANGQRLTMGEGVRGGFHSESDIDYYLFRLDAPSPVEISIRPPGDGAMDALLYLANHNVGSKAAFDPGDGPYTFRSTLPAGDWSLVLRAQAPVIQNQYEVSINRLPVLEGNEPDDKPLNAVKLPRDGDIADSVGAFDGADQIFVPLPEGEGVAAMICAVDPDVRHGRWRLYHWSDDSRLADIKQGIAVFPYGPGLGGAVRFGLDATEKPVTYDCSLRFPPIGPPPPTEAEPPGETTVALTPGQTRRMTVFDSGPTPELALDLEPGDMAFAACRDTSGNLVSPDTRAWGIKGASKPTNELLGGYQALIAESEPSIYLSRTYSKRLEGVTLPFEVDCTLLGPDHLARPADMGPPAEFRISEPLAAEDDGRTTSTGPPPPGLEALIAREAPASQPQGDLPVEIAIADLAELAAFNEAGQRFEATVSLVSEAEKALPVEVEAAVDGEGWRIDRSVQNLTIEPGVPGRITVQVVAPPWLSPALTPALTVTVRSGDSFSAALKKLPVSPTAVPARPFTYWHAPDALRGGLNVLHYGLGARLIEWGEEIPDESKQKVERALHDGLAPHINSVNVYKSIAFRLAASAEIAGIMIQLRSTAGEESWPAEMLVFMPAENGGWTRIGATALETLHGPQYLVFDKPVTTDRLRFEFPRCWASCRYPYIQDIQAIATPGTHPEGLPPINAADPDLGGHVVWSTERFGGAWNREFLVGEPTASNSGWPRAGSEPAVITVAFHQNRAALIDTITWIGDPDDTARLPEARVESSLAGPNGPWSELGRLSAPPLGETRSSLDFDEPVWARYLRFTLEIPENGPRHYGPDAIEVLETPGTSTIGLWEDDQPRAAYEASISAGPPVAVPPAGGPSREQAVALELDTAVKSSVVIERNEDWWQIDAAEGQFNRLLLEFERDLPMVVPELSDAEGNTIELTEDGGPGTVAATLQPGTYYLRVFEPPRSVVITWDTSGSVGHYVPRTLAAVRTWARGLKPGRDALQLLPFGPKGFLLEDWAETPEEIEPALAALPEENSSNSEEALLKASIALAERRGSRGIVIMTDAETGIEHELWPAMLNAMPRVISLSVDSNSRENGAVMMDWAQVNGGHFRRVIGPLGLADSMEMANALFRAPKAYTLTASLEELVEVEGEAKLTISASGEATASGAVELILDASGSMLQRMEGQRRIDVAHAALTGLVRDTLPEGMPFAFRAFGLEEDACRSELIVPLGPLDREAAAKAIEGVPAINLAKTAIADSLRAAATDLAEAAPPRVVVLVTDGEETCEGDPEAAIAELRESGLDARVNIVGFAIDDEALAETFSSWAESGGGTYFDARGAEALEQSIADALKPRFDITRTYLDGRTEVVGRAALGETITVPAGQLTIAPGSAATGDAVTLQVQPGGSITLDYAPESGLSQRASED